MPEERNRLAPPTRLPGGWLGCLGLDTHFQRLFSSSRTHQPPPSPPSNRRFLSDRADPPMIFTTALAHEFISRVGRHSNSSMENGTRRSRSRARSLCDVRFDVIGAGRQLTIKGSRFHETFSIREKRGPR